jgi:Ca2+-transporting ATPase
MFRANSAIVFAEIFRSFASRSATKLFWEVGALSNLMLLGVVMASFAIQLAIHQLPTTRALFQIGDLSGFEGGLTVAVGLIPVSVLELSKLVRRKR